MRLTAGDRDKAVRLRAEGWSTASIAEVLGCSHSVATEAVRGVPTPAVVFGSDGRRHATAPTPRPGSRRCVWCDHWHLEAGEYCTAKCEEERRRYRAFVAGTLRL